MDVSSEQKNKVYHGVSAPPRQNSNTMKENMQSTKTALSNNNKSNDLRTTIISRSVPRRTLAPSLFKAVKTIKLKRNPPVTPRQLISPARKWKPFRFRPHYVLNNETTVLSTLKLNITRPLETTQNLPENIPTISRVFKSRIGKKLGFEHKNKTSQW